jgi:hypothetical protein
VRSPHPLAPVRGRSRPKASASWPWTWAISAGACRISKSFMRHRPSRGDFMSVELHRACGNGRDRRGRPTPPCQAAGG